MFNNQRNIHENPPNAINVSAVAMNLVFACLPMKR